MGSHWQRELLRAHGLRPKRALSQNFLLDETYLTRIADAAALPPACRVLEIGPGLGGLTRHLAARAGHVVAVEIDRQLAALLQERFRAQAHVRIVCQDFLACRWAELWTDEAEPEAFVVVANLPYHAANRMLMRLLAAKEAQPSRLTVLVQEDVALRICARPGAMSLLAVGCQYYAECRLGLRIPPGAFFPQPKVRSALVHLETRARSARGDAPDATVFALARAGFGQKRKQLVNALSRQLGRSRSEVQVWLHAAGVEPRRRAETLSVAEWTALARQCARDIVSVRG